MVDTEDGPFWLIDGQKVAPSGRKSVGAIRADAHGFRPGAAKTRIEDLVNNAEALRVRGWNLPQAENPAAPRQEGASEIVPPVGPAPDAGIPPVGPAREPGLVPSVRP